MTKEICKCGHSIGNHSSEKYYCRIRACKCKKFEAQDICNICRDKKVRSNNSDICEDCEK